MWPFARNRPRYLPERPFPAYAHLPGTTPHPSRSSDGHSFGVPEVVPARLDPDDPGASPDYLWGFDLLNHGYLWEAHSAWEGLWHAEDHTGATADLLKALIRVAAAGVKARQGQPGGTKTHMGAAADLCEAVEGATGQVRWAGIRLADLAVHCRGVAAACPEAGAHPDLDGTGWTWALRLDPEPPRQD